MVYGNSCQISSQPSVIVRGSGANPKTSLQGLGVEPQRDGVGVISGM